MSSAQGEMRRRKAQLWLLQGIASGLCLSRSAASKVRAVLSSGDRKTKNVRNGSCRYSRQDRTLLQILDRLGRVETLLETINTRGGDSLPQSVTTSPKGSVSKPASPPQSRPPLVSRPSIAPGNTMQEIPMEEDEQLTIPYQHTTAAHKLLWWPSIRKIVDDDFLKHDSYVIDEEQNRGTLRIYGRGEETSGGDPTFAEDSEYAGPSSEGWSGMFYNGAWESGTEGRKTNGTSVEDDDHTMDQGNLLPQLLEHGIGGLGSDGKLRLDRQTVQELLNSYLTNIHILHPILDKASITDTVFRFVDLFGCSPQQDIDPSSSGLGLGGDTNGTETAIPSPRSHRNSISGKRKRSMSLPRQQATGLPPPPRSIPRTVHSALVLLVLALGSVCSHRRPVPGPLPKAQYPSVFSSTASPFGSSATPPFSAASPPYQQQQQQQQQQFSAGGIRGRPDSRNIDVIPGLAYFSQAMDIMGALIGSNELENVQAGLLAGLYWGQLGRVLDSWKWISWACMGCQILIRMLVLTAHTQPSQRTPTDGGK